MQTYMALQEVYTVYFTPSTTLIACNLFNRKGIGIDIDENYCKISIDRLREKGRQRQLF